MKGNEKENVSMYMRVFLTTNTGAYPYLEGNAFGSNGRV